MILNDKEMAPIKRLLILVLTICSLPTFVVSQNQEILPWSSTRKITVEDFYIKTKSLETTISFAQFSIDYQVNSFDFLRKNFNKKVQNYMIKSASWIDTTASINQSLLYQQTLFDLSEIYTRQFRKSLRENRKKFISGTEIAKELNNKTMTDFSKRRIDYDRDTQFATELTKQKEWEMEIQEELEALSDYAYDK